ncbi:MAG: response regulator transcription factor [Anaerolineales bacterium]|nr:response regulator transcription factor [Anaerolineales bacterium]
MPEAKILLVEGKRAGGLSLAPALQKSSYCLQVVYTGAAAVEWLQTEKPDLVVFDASAMRTTGVRSCRRIRQLVGETPMIYALAAEQVEDLTAEADVYLQRPFTSRKVLNRIRVLLPADDATEEVVRCGSLTYFRTKRSLASEGGEKRLTPKLALLLEEFLRHPNQLITRLQLMENVWNTTYIGDTRTLDVHIRWIRECIEQNPARPQLLRTVRGKGYIFAMKG